MLVFEDITIISGLWQSDTHVSIIDNYLYSSGNIGTAAYNKLTDSRVSIMGVMAKAADKQYGGSDDFTSTLHGTGNYKKGLKYLFHCAQNVLHRMCGAENLCHRPARMHFHW